MLIAAMFLTVVSIRAQTTFSNTAPITIPDTTTAPAPANPYPSTINVSGLSGNITKVTVQLTNFTHTFPDDVDMLLVSPSGAMLVLWSDVCGSLDVVNQIFTLDDAAASALPDSGPCVSGTFRPTSVGTLGDAFPAPAPAPNNPGDYAAPGGAATFASQFNGTNPNGTWSLYVVDDGQLSGGSISGGWSLTITTSLATAASVSVSGRVLTPTGRGLVNARVVLTESNGTTRSAITTPFGFYRFTDIEVGQTYTIGVFSKRYQFQPRIIHVTEEVENLNLTSQQILHKY